MVNAPVRGRAVSAVPAALAADAPIDRNPAALYLSSLRPAGRRGMTSQLNRAAGMLTDGRVTSALALDWARVRFQHVQALRSRMLEPRLDGSVLAAATVNLTISGVRGCVRQAWLLGLVPAEVWDRVREVKPVRGPRLPAGRHVDEFEIAALFQGCEGLGHVGARDAALLALLYGGGLRRSEAVTVEAADYERARGGVRVRHGKGGAERMVYLSVGARRAVNAWLRVRGDWEGALLAPVRGDRVEQRPMTGHGVLLRVKVIAARSGVAPLSPHDLRRSFVGALCSATGDLSAVQQLAGHASVVTTQRYDRRGEAVKRKVASALRVPFGGGGG